MIDVKHCPMEENNILMDDKMEFLQVRLNIKYTTLPFLVPTGIAEVDLVVVSPQLHTR